MGKSTSEILKTLEEIASESHSVQFYQGMGARIP